MTTATANPGISWLQAQQRYRDNAEARRAAIDDLEAALYDKATFEHAYRKALSIAYTQHRNKGKGAGESELHAKAAAADKALDRDMADGAAKAAGQRLEQLEGERASLRQLVDWVRDES